VPSHAVNSRQLRCDGRPDWASEQPRQPVSVRCFGKVYILVDRGHGFQRIVNADSIMLVPILKWTYRWGPVPGFWPSRLVIRSGASWAGYPVLMPVVALCWATLAALCITAVLSGVVNLLGII
jgi:hypothetical protein